MVEISESLICLKSSTYIVCRLEEKRKTTFIFFFFFFFFLLGIIVTSNRIHIMKKKPISLFLLFFLTRCVFFLFFHQLKKIFDEISTFFFFSLFDKALCKLCAFSSNVSLCLKKADGVSPVYLCLLLLSLSPSLIVI